MRLGCYEEEGRLTLTLGTSSQDSVSYGHIQACDYKEKGGPSREQNQRIMANATSCKQARHAYCRTQVRSFRAVRFRNQTLLLPPRRA